MRTIRTLMATSLVATLAISALAAPASAADPGRMTFVNGIPGTKVDICVGKTTELRSRLAYGKVFKKKLIGTKKLRIRKASSGICRGKVLAGKTVRFARGSDKTVVATSKRPKVLVFDNVGLGTLATDPDGAIALRHAADLPANDVYFRWTVWGDPIIKDAPFTLSAGETFTKADEFTSNLFVVEDRVMRVKVTRSNPANVVAAAPLVDQIRLRRYEYVLVGNRQRNARLVPIVSALSAAPLPAS